MMTTYTWLKSGRPVGRDVMAGEEVAPGAGDSAAEAEAEGSPAAGNDAEAEADASPVSGEADVGEAEAALPHPATRAERTIARATAERQEADGLRMAPLWPYRR
jgi:hypothetical protein